MLIDILKDNLISLSKECEEMIKDTDSEKLIELRKNILKIRSEDDILRILKN